MKLDPIKSQNSGKQRDLSCHSSFWTDSQNLNQIRCRKIQIWAKLIMKVIAIIVSIISAEKSKADQKICLMIV